MSGLDAGSVFATLGGRFSPAGFNAFGSAMYKAKADMDKAEREMTASQARVSKSMHAMGQAAKIGAVGGIAGLGVVIGYSIKKAADFEAQLDALGSVSGASARQMGQLKKQAMDAGAATKYSALQAAQAQTELSKGGLSVSRILGGALKGALSLAAAGELDLADAATYTVNALKQFQLRGGDATHVADAFATAANQTTFDVKDLGDALAQGGGAAHSAGLSFNQTVAAIEALSTQTQSGADAGTSLKTALIQLLSPTKQQAEAAKSAGLSFIDQSGKMKSLTAISEMLRAKTGDMTKAQRTALFSTIAGTDGLRTLLALYQTGPDQLGAYEQALERQGTAAKVAAEKQDNLKGKVENFKGSVETAAIAVGDKLLPGLTELAIKGTDAFNRFVASGQADRFGEGVVRGGQEALRVLGDLAHVGGQVAGVLLDVGRALDLGDATNIEAILAAIAGFKIAGVVAPLVVGLASALGNLVMAARTAPTFAAFLGDIGLLANPITAVAAGAGALAGALVLLGGHESAETQAARANADAHKAQAEAIKSVQDAERAAADRGLAAKQSTLDLKQAQNDLAEARKKYGKGSDEYKQALVAEQRAALRSKDAHDEYAKSIEHENRVNDDRISRAQRHIAETQKEVKAAKDVAFIMSRTSNANDQAKAQERLERAQSAQTDAVQAYIQAVARANVSETSRQRLMNSASQVTEKNAQGISHLLDALSGLPNKKQTSILLTGDQTVLAKLGTMASQLTALGQRKTVTKVLSETSSAQAAVLAFKALLQGVPPRRVAQVVAETKGAAEVSALKALIASTNSKSVAIDVTTRYHQIGNPSAGAGVGTATPGGARRPGRAAGRGPGGHELALVGEGRTGEWKGNPFAGWTWVGEPTVMPLGPEDYVIPTDRQFRGRALGWLAEMFGLEGYAGGKGAKKKPAPKPAAKPKKQRFVPSHLDPLSLPVGDFETKEQDARTKLNDAKGVAHDEPAKIRDIKAQIRDIERRKPKTAAQKANKADDLRRARKKLQTEQAKLDKARGAIPKLRAEWQERKKELEQAKKNAAELQRLQDLADTAADEMGLADRHDDQGAYDAAKSRRDKALTARRALLAKAKELAAKAGNTDYAASLGAEIARADVDIFDNQGSESQSDQDADDAAKQAAEDAAQAAEEAKTKAGEIARGERLSDADQGTLDQLEEQAALAKVDTPDDLGDDTSVAEKLVAFREGVLGALRTSPTATPSAIKDAADAVVEARDNLKQLAASAISKGATAGTDEIVRQFRDQLDTYDQNRRDVLRGGSNLVGGGVTINQRFDAPPPDPHTQSQMLRLTLESALGL